MQDEFSFCLERVPTLVGCMLLITDSDSGWKTARSEKMSRIVTYPTNRYLFSNKRS